MAIKALLVLALLAPILTPGAPAAVDEGDTAQQGGGSSADAVNQERPSKSYGFYVGKNRTEDGSVLLGGTGEEVSGHWLEIVPHQEHPPDATITVGVTEEASIPGELFEIPQVEETYKYITMNYSNFAGFPPPLTNGGLNEHQVAIRDIWSPSRDELVEMTPTPQRGLQYSDLARIALERATTAEEAVEVIGELIDEHGFATYGGNSHMIADPNEGWVVKQMAGGQGLWVAERLGPDEIRVSYPGYIGEIPQNFQDDPNYMGSDNLISFAADQGWYDPNTSQTFNVHEVYGDQDLPLRSGAKYMSQAAIEEELANTAPVTVDEMMAMVRDERIADDEAGYGQVAHLRDDLPHPELATLWVAPTGSVTAPFIPWRIGVQDVLPEYGQHRYLYRNASSTFLNPDFQLQEATQFAGRLFKRLMYYTCAHPDVFLPEVTETLDAFEGQMLEEQPGIEQAALTLFNAEQPELARQMLTYYSNTQAEEGLELGEALVGSIEARTKLLYGIPEPEGDEINMTGPGETVNCLVGADPDQPPEN